LKNNNHTIQQYDDCFIGACKEKKKSLALISSSNKDFLKIAKSFITK